MRMKLKLILLMVFIFSLNAVDGNAQALKKKKGKKKKEQVQQSQQSNSLRPYVPDEKQISKKKSKKGKNSFADLFNKQLDNKVEEFYQRLEDNSKRNRKIEKKMQHPQYSDFSYFGHKKKPKIRPVGKRKFCKECGIVH